MIWYVIFYILCMDINLYTCIYPHPYTYIHAHMCIILHRGEVLRHMLPPWSEPYVLKAVYFRPIVFATEFLDVYIYLFFFLKFLFNIYWNSMRVQYTCENKLLTKFIKYIKYSLRSQFRFSDNDSFRSGIKEHFWHLTQLVLQGCIKFVQHSEWLEINPSFITPIDTESLCDLSVCVLRLVPNL